MAASLLFWLGLLLTGYVILRLFSPEDVESGLLGTVGLSYLVAFAALSPVSIVCYVLHLPVAVLSSACALLAVAAAFVVAHRVWWRDLGKLLVVGVSVELIIVIADMIMGARVGAYLGAGDVRAHVARIRFLLDHGFSNFDPFIAERFFFPIYHTNLQHALFASCSQLTGVDVLGVWYMALMPAKLLIAAGGYYMGWCLYGRRWVGWVTALLMVGWQAPITYAVYPNKLAPLWLLPIMIGFGVQAVQSPDSPKPAFKLAMGSLVLGQVHGMYAVFAGLVLGPLLAGLFLVRLGQRKAGRRQAAACVAALFVGAPFVLISDYGRASRLPRADAAPTPTEKFHHWDNGWAMADPRKVMGDQSALGLAVLGAGVCWVVMGSRRREASVLVAVAATIAVVVFVPPVCGAVIRWLGAEWMVARLGALLGLCVAGLGIGAAAFLLEPRLRWWWLRALISLGVVFVGSQFSKARPPHDWETYLDRVRVPTTAERPSRLEGLRALRAFCREHIPAGATVLGDAQTQLWLVMVHDCYGVSIRKGGGVRDVHQRRRDVREMLHPTTPWPARRILLRKYGINLFMFNSHVLKDAAYFDWTREHWAGTPMPIGDFILVPLAVE